MAATVRRRDGQLDISEPRRLFVARPRPPVRLDAYAWDVASDGRFLVNTLVEEPASSMITLVLNWTAVFPRQRAPAVLRLRDQVVMALDQH
jgi:hypothetical protein